jgi:hypothetical protein
MAGTQFNFTKPPKLFFGFSGEQARELALLTEALVATTGMRPRPRPGQTLEMALIMEGLAARAEAVKPQGVTALPIAMVTASAKTAPSKPLKKPPMKAAPARRLATVESLSHPSEEEHFSIRELAEKWHKGYETVRRWVLEELGVLKTDGGTGKRAYYSISKSMAQRIYNKHST